MDHDLLDIWADLLERRTGTSLPEERRSFLETSISLRMKEIGEDDFECYFHSILLDKKGECEWQILVDRLTIHETRFFRHKPSLALLETIILPELFNTEADKKDLKIWSAGCSTGEEAYTLYMIADQFLQKEALNFCSLLVTGTDISTPSLEFAKKAVYNKLRVRHVPENYLKDYFIKQPKNRFQVIDSVKKNVCLMPSNIMDMEKIVLHSMDIIFCQNVLIYFSKNKCKKIIRDLVNRLKPGGYLVLGAGEVLNISCADLEKVNFLDALAFLKKKKSN